jgi:hypothetical protein
MKLASLETNMKKEEKKKSKKKASLRAETQEQRKAPAEPVGGWLRTK